MNDRERVLMNIAVQTSGSIFDTMEKLPNGWAMRFSYRSPSPQFVPEEVAKLIGIPIVPGDIVRCVTNPNHAWGISELVKFKSSHEFLLREIGGEKLCNMGNESIDVLRFMPPHLLYTGVKMKLYTWVTRKAFSEQYNPDANHFIRCGGVEFEGDTLVIWIRPHAFDCERRMEDGTTQYAHPRKVTLKWSEKTRLKDIVSAMRDQGFADEFDYSKDKPTNGMGGCVIMNREDIENMIAGACV